jgi:lipopolysaccharide/colanic/teichoic acid biosynthesis glycosyltransferase
VSEALPHRRVGFYQVSGKIVFDWLFILASLPIVLPLIGIFALLAALDGAAPFYRQRRVGRNGKVFHMIKIRTMVPDAEHILQEYLEQNPEAGYEWEHKQKLRYDPRITRLGRFLRKTSLDELPQMWNVLRGEMSLIGPRPMMVDQRVLYPGSAYYRMRPGITGLWQVSDRNQSSFAERAYFDTTYYNDLSLRADLSIFIRTIGVVLRGTGY